MWNGYCTSLRPGCSGLRSPPEASLGGSKTALCLSRQSWGGGAGKRPQMDLWYLSTLNEISLEITVSPPQVNGICPRSHSVMSNSLRPHGLYSARRLCPRASPGKNTGVGCRILLQGILQAQGSNLCILRLLHGPRNLLPMSHQGRINKWTQRMPDLGLQELWRLIRSPPPQVVG